MSNNEYPKEIYMAGDEFSNFLVGKGSPIGDMAEKAYDLGFDTGFNSSKNYALAGAGDWHNLTEAIASGEPIDFEKLDGRRVRFTSESFDCVETTLTREEAFFAHSVNGWDCPASLLFRMAWNGADGWTLWVDGEIPMKKQTADTLPFGTSFKDSHGNEYVVVARNKVQALYGNHNVTPAGNIIVAEFIGMYGQKESE
ncbi:hypothetical protein [uncultured Rothia sp.]|uniref:hypothetical protein n=1 Tax=uncultured Rothia sp. TaxID=316088 RepID=UPI0032174892